LTNVSDVRGETNKALEQGAMNDGESRPVDYEVVLAWMLRQAEAALKDAASAAVKAKRAGTASVLNEYAGALERIRKGEV
jgi:hypothetical protein